MHDPFLLYFTEIVFKDCNRKVCKKGWIIKWIKMS